jgi:hypothetical protein
MKCVGYILLILGLIQFFFAISLGVKGASAEFVAVALVPPMIFIGLAVLVLKRKTDK